MVFTGDVRWGCMSFWLLVSKGFSYMEQFRVGIKALIFYGFEFPPPLGVFDVHNSTTKLATKYI